jgi:DNA adenine methylase
MSSSIFRYPGGKAKKSVLNKLFAKTPKSYKEFREPFVGGGAVFFNINLNVQRWINDRDEHLIEVYKALNDRPEQFIAACREIEPPKEGEPLTSSKVGGKPLWNARLKRWFDHFADNENCDQALRYFFINRTVWAGRVNYDLPSRMYYSNPNGWNIVKTNKLECAANVLKGTRITCGSYSSLLAEAGIDVFIYLDPPYYVNTHLNKNSQLYKYNFTVEDHIALAENVKNCNHMVMLSYDDDKDGFIRSLYKGFYIHKENWTYCGTSSAKGMSKTKKIGNELIITNYKL